jgi:chromosome partitioning protein
MEEFRMESLRDAHTIRSVDLRTTLRVAPATLSDIYKKAGIIHSSEEAPTGRGASKNILASDVRKILETRGYSYPTSARIVSFMMCKGGVGKTTSTYYLAQRLSGYGCRVLAIDADSQGNMTSAFNLDQFGCEIDAETPILVDVLTNQCSIHEAIIAVTPNLHLIPSNPLNATLEGKIREHHKNPSVPLKRVLTPLLKHYDYILVDCAPALNLTNTAIVSASDMVVLPVAPDKFSQLGLDQTLQEIGQIEQDFNLQIAKRIIFTKFDAREFTSLKYLAEIADKHKNNRFETAIRTCADVKNAITRKEDLFSLKKSNAREDYDAFARELMGLDKFFGVKRTPSADN